MDTVAANYEPFTHFNRSQWDEATIDTKKWTETVENHSSEDVHSETASSPYSTSGTVASDVISTPSPEVKPDITEPALNQPLDADETNVKPTFDELNVDVSSPSSNACENFPSLPSSEFENATITMGAKFTSFDHFESVFKPWMHKNFHPFRVASSEQMRHPDGAQDTRFRYRYIVYHCVHYGNPRMRGNGKRPNQSYLPSGCKAMLRLNLNYGDQALRITTLHTEHQNHEIGPEHFGAKRPKISPHFDKVKKESPGSRSSNTSVSSSSVKHSPNSFVASSWSPSTKNLAYQPFPVVKEEINQTTPSLSTLLATAYNNTGSIFPQPQNQTLQSLLQPVQPPVQVSSSEQANKIPPVMNEQKENLRLSSQPNFAQIPMIQNLLNMPNLPLPSATPNSLNPAFSTDLLTKMVEMVQQQMVNTYMERARQEKHRTLQEEYQQLMQSLSSCYLNLDTEVLERAVQLLRQVVEFVRIPPK